MSTNTSASSGPRGRNGDHSGDRNGGQDAPAGGGTGDRPVALPAGGRPSTGDASHGSAGMVIGGRYTLVAPVGTGGMGAVWRATDRLLRREVAIKEVALPAGMSADERDALTERTLREARAAAALSHPSVVRVFDVVTDGGRPWIVMELLKAHSLAELIERDGTVAPRAVAKIGLAMLGALEAAHDAGVLHRDVKPGNVLICADGRCVLTDFGVARSVRDAELTTPGMVLGSPHFISPERATGGQFGPPSDLFSLGVTLYTAVEGRAPFDRGDALSTMHAVVNDPPEPPRRAAELAPVLYGLLEKDPARRWEVAQTRAALRVLLLGSSAAAPAQPQPTAALPTAHPPPPAASPRTSLMPTSPSAAPAADPWRVGRASVPQPGSAAPRIAPPVAPPRGAVPYPGRLGPPRPVARGRAAGAWIFAAAAVLVAFTLVLTGVYGAGWFGGTGEAVPDQSSPVATGPPFEVQTYQGQGMSLHVPANWKKRDRGNYVQYHDPADPTAWLRINVTQDTRAPDRILRAADRNFVKGCCGLTRYRKVALRPGKLAGHDGAELEYLGTSTRTGERRHGIWRMIVVGDRNYQVYMSVPDDRFSDHRQVYDEAVSSMRLAG